MGFLSILSDVIKPVTQLIDNLSTSDKEKGELRNELTRIENTFAEKVLEYESKLLQFQSDIIVAEAKGESALQRSWRPISMLVLLTLVVLDSFGWLKNPLAPEAWTLLQVGIGGYVIGRSAEKIVPNIIKRVKKGGTNG